MTGEPRVLIDATAVPADRGGVGRYVDGLVSALGAAGAPMVVACQPRDAALFGQLAPQARIVPARESVATRTARLSWEQTTLPLLARTLGADVVHSPHYTLPLCTTAASVVTLHDATFFTHRRLHSPVKAQFFRTWTRLALARAHVGVVPSEATGAELQRVARADRGKLVVAAHGVDPEAFYPPSAAEAAEVRGKLRLGSQPYVAFLGALEPRKNVPALLRAFTLACAQRPDPPALVVAGPAGWDPAVTRALEQVPHRLRVLRTGYLDFADLPGFLGGAQLVAYPSLGEGFGLPVLEAMACGAAVLTTRRLALPEVGGEAVAYCGPVEGPVSDEEIAVGLTALLDDPSRREQLSAAAQAQAKEFTWNACADQHRRAYDLAHFRHRNRKG